MVKLDKQFSL